MRFIFQIEGLFGESALRSNLNPEQITELVNAFMSKTNEVFAEVFNRVLSVNQIDTNCIDASCNFIVPVDESKDAFKRILDQTIPPVRLGLINQSDLLGVLMLPITAEGTTKAESGVIISNNTDQASQITLQIRASEAVIKAYRASATMLAALNEDLHNSLREAALKTANVRATELSNISQKDEQAT